MDVVGVGVDVLCCFCGILVCCEWVRVEVFDELVFFLGGDDFDFGDVDVDCFLVGCVDDGMDFECGVFLFFICVVDELCFVYV